ncbi:FAD:protein FMN transferase [Bradyrhizobium quebecense]|uniref:FAD:protein FMN transferase n=1 Tax=Bradyrhizobium quebecense TaxID=2748629 RepID=A0A973WUX2_9BRAD|nr:FAD:protein FMN transferase [Bradyrhizobium quebecense]UGA43173.1 FAD:protein FMN transferase [Bradyrhizobium quebecense]
MPVVSDSLRRARPLLGTFVEIEVAAAAGPETNAAINAAFDAVARVHRLMSFHEHDSDVSRVNRDAGVRPTRVHAWTFEVLEAALEMRRRSKGAFDVTVAPVLQAMGLLPGPGGGRVIGPEQSLDNAIELLPELAVRLRSPCITIDLGGIAKGFAVDRAVEVLRGFDIPGGVVNAGGDLRVFGQEQHTVHLRDPRDPLHLLARIKLTDQALASTALRFDLVDGAPPGTSAIIDPATGNPTNVAIGATVCAPSCMIADALTKAVMISGTDAGDLLEHYKASALLISTDGDVRITSDWPQAVHLAA